VPAALGVYRAWQEDNLPTPERVQGELVKLPGLSVAKLTVPEGGVGIVEVSFTCAVHVVTELSSTGVGLHETTVVVG
jgi:hypothetical protein